MFQSANIITLTTDFGLDDPYVGQMKGAVLCRNPLVRIVDLCHAIPSQDVFAAAIALQSSWHFFPAGTVHVAVVDPGVGSDRRILAAASDDQLFLAPDNGLLSPLMEDRTIQCVHVLANRILFAKKISPTFHGRDIIAPAAAMLASGFPFKETGPQADIASCVRLTLPKPMLADRNLQGQVIQVDHFGNLRTNISKAELINFVASDKVTVHIKEQQAKFCQTYADGKPGGLIALIDSAGYLELAVNRGNAAQVLACGLGQAVIVQRHN